MWGTGSHDGGKGNGVSVVLALQSLSEAVIGGFGGGTFAAPRAQYDNFWGSGRTALKVGGEAPAAGV